MRSTYLFLISSSLVVLSAPLYADDFTVSSTSSSTNGGHTVNGSDNLTVTSAGSISPVNAHGISTTGGSNTITVEGSITTLNGRSGIQSTNESDNQITLSGSAHITSTSNGAQGTGINIGGGSGGNNNSITLSDSAKITTIGNSGIGISIFGDNNTLTLSKGTEISTSGTSADGIYVYDGSGNTINVAGKIKATNTDAKAVHLEGGANGVVNFQEGALIIGPIHTDNDYATGSILNIDVGLGTSYIFTTSGTWTVNDLDGRSFTYSGNVASSLSAGNSETADEMLFMSTGSLQSSLKSNVSSDESGWVDIYARSSERKANTAQPTMLPYKANASGLSIGVPVLSGARSLDVVINSHHAALNIADDSQILDSLSTKLGVVLTQAPTSDGWQLAGSAFVGRTSHDGTRGKVLDNLAETGMRSLTSEFSSNDAVLAIGANYSTELSKTMRFEGGLEGSYAYQDIAAYSESSNFSWAARKLAQTSGKVSAGVVYQSSENLNYQFRLGAQHRTVIQGVQTSYTAYGTAYSLDAGLTSETYYDAEVRFNYLGGDGMNLTGSLGGFSSDLTTSGMTAHLWLNWAF